MVTTDGRDTRWVEHREARRRALVEDALRAIRRHGAGVGMDEIAAQAETSKTVIYRHFGDRAGLYAAVVASVHDFIHHDLAAALELTDPGDLSVLARDLADAYLGLVERDPEIYRFVLKAPEADPSGTIDAYGGLPELMGDHVSTAIAGHLRAQRPGPGLRAHLGPRAGRVHPGGRRPVDGQRSTASPRRSSSPVSMPSSPPRWPQGWRPSRNSRSSHDHDHGPVGTC